MNYQNIWLYLTNCFLIFSQSTCVMKKQSSLYFLGSSNVCSSSMENLGWPFVENVCMFVDVVICVRRLGLGFV